MSSIKWLESFWTFIFPATCSGCDEGVEIRGDWCPKCREGILDVRKLPLNESSVLDELWVIGDYRGHLRRNLIHYKFPPYDRGLRFSFWRLLDLGRDKLPDWGEEWVACPIPLHKTREKTRGFNPGEEIFRKWLKKNFNIGWSSLLKRERETEPQSTLGTKAQRFENVKGAFSIESIVDGRSILLVDDIFTSGATLEAAAEVLKKGGAYRVNGLVLASGVLIGEEKK